MFSLLEKQNFVLELRVFLNLDVVLAPYLGINDGWLEPLAFLCVCGPVVYADVVQAEVLALRGLYGECANAVRTAQLSLALPLPILDQPYVIQVKLLSGLVLHQRN